MKKIVKFLLNSCFLSLGLFFVLLVTILFLGYKPYIVKSGSMEPCIETGSLAILNTNYKYEDLKIGDIIAYNASIEEDVSVTHRIIGMDNGLIETKGDNNEVSDGFCVSENNYIGLTKYTIPKVGYIFSWMQTKRGMIIFVTIMALLILLDILVTSSNKKQKVVKNNEN